MTDIGVTTTDYLVDDRSWLGSAHGFEAAESGTLDLTSFDTATVFTNGFIPSGVCLAIDPATGKVGRYFGPGTDEDQTITISATGGTFTISAFGNATAAIAWNATAAAVQAALELLPSIEPGDVTVTGGPGGTAAYHLKWAGQYADMDVPAVTTGAGSLTGGSGTATVATATAGATGSSTGSGNYTKGVGHLKSAVPVPTSGATTVGCAFITHGKVRVANLPAHNGLDDAFKVNVGSSIRYI